MIRKTVWLIDSQRPGKQFFSHVGTESPLPGYYQYFLGSKCALLKDTTQFDPSGARIHSVNGQVREKTSKPTQNEKANQNC